MTDTLLLTAVIGGTGKTGCAHLVRHLLSQSGDHKTALITSRHSYVTEKELSPPDRLRWHDSLLTILGSIREENCTHAVLTIPMEMILSGEANGLRLETAVVTGAAPETAAAVGSFLERNARRLVCNLDDEGSRAIACRWQGAIVTYGENRIEADLSGKNLRLLPGRIVFEGLTRHELRRIELSVLGGYDMYQALGAMGCALLGGMSLSDCAGALRHSPGIPGRMELLRGDGGEQVLIDSASTPEAVENLLYTARSMTGGELLLVLRPPERWSAQARHMLGAVCTMADRVYLTPERVGDRSIQRLYQTFRAGMNGTPRPCLIFGDRGLAIHSALQRAEKEDMVILSGRGDQRTPFDERALLERYHIHSTV